MGLCKCRTVTPWYCFVHKKHVCENCVLDPEHANCVVSTYLAWIRDSFYEWPAPCVLCQQPLSQSEVARLPCFHAVHVRCLRESCDTLPRHTAPAGFACPICAGPILPPEPKTKLGKKLHEHFSDTWWFSRALSDANALVEEEPVAPPPGSALPVTVAAAAVSSESAAAAVPAHLAPAAPAVGFGADEPPPDAKNQATAYSHSTARPIASYLTASDALSDPKPAPARSSRNDDDDDKYSKQSRKQRQVASRNVKLFAVFTIAVFFVMIVAFSRPDPSSLTPPSLENDRSV